MRDVEETTHRMSDQTTVPELTGIFVLSLYHHSVWAWFSTIIAPTISDRIFVQRIFRLTAVGKVYVWISAFIFVWIIS